MSLIDASWSSGSSGPSPNTSSSTSSDICCRSRELSRVCSPSSKAISAERTSLRSLRLSMDASASRLILSNSLRCSVNLSSWYSGLRAALVLPALRRRRWSQLSSALGLLASTIGIIYSLLVSFRSALPHGKRRSVFAENRFQPQNGRLFPHSLRISEQGLRELPIRHAQLAVFGHRFSFCQ